MKRPLLVGSVAAVALVVLSACGGQASTGSDRHAAVREAGATVMPFNLDETKHTFDKTEYGGAQTVYVIDAANSEQVALVREHLREIQGEFSAGNFQDPTSIHGGDMPGLAALSDGADQVTITYRDIDGGGELTYTSEDPTLIDALHLWFDAQVSDHGPDVASPDVGVGHVVTEEMWRLHHGDEPYPFTSPSP